MSKKEQMKSREKTIHVLFYPEKLTRISFGNVNLEKKTSFLHRKYPGYLANIFNVNICVNSMSFAIQNIIKQFILYHIFKPSKIERAFENKNLRAA